MTHKHRRFAAAQVTCLLLLAAMAVAAETVVLQPTYVRNPRSGLYGPGRYGQAIGLYDRMGPEYPVLFPHTQASDGTLSVWFRPTRETLRSFTRDTLVTLSDGSRSLRVWRYYREQKDKSRIRVLYVSGSDERRTRKTVYYAGPRLGDDYAGAFHHLAVTWDKGSVCVYLDGERIARREKPEELLGPFDARKAILRVGGFVSWADDVMVLSRALGDAEVQAVASAKTGWTIDEWTALHVPFDGDLLARATLEPTGDVVRMFPRLARPEATFLKDDPRQIVFHVANLQAAESNLSLTGVVHGLDRVEVARKTVPVSAPSGTITEAIIDLSDVTRNGLFWGDFTLGDGWGTLQDEEIRFAFTRGADPATHSPEDVRTGLVIGRGFNPAAYGRWNRISYEAQWRNIEREPGLYYFDRLDLLVDAMVTHGVRPVPNIYGLPPWHVETSRTKHVHGFPKDLDAYRAFVRAMAERYKGKIHDYMLIGEAYCDAREGSLSAKEYATLINVTAEVVKAVDPAARVPSDIGGYASWIKTVAEMTAGKADYYLIHPYDFVNGQNPALLRDETHVEESIMSVLREYGANLAIANDEFACYTLGRHAVFDDGVPMTEQEYLDTGRWVTAHSVRHARGRHQFVDWHTGAFRVVRGMCLDRVLGGLYSMWWDTGCGGFSSLLVNFREPSTQSVALANWTGFMAGYDFVRRLDLGADYLKAYLFRKGSDYQIVSFTDTRPTPVFLELEGDVQAFDHYANPFPIDSIGSVRKVRLRAITPVYLCNVRNVVASPPLLKVTRDAAELFPTMPARVTVSVYNPLDQTVGGNVFLDVSYPFSPVQGRQVTLAGREQADVEFVLTVPETASGETPVVARFETDSIVLKSVTIESKLMVRQSTVVDYASGPVAVDGDLSDWGPVEQFPMRIGREQQLLKGVPYTQTYVPRIDWKGTADLSARARVAYDERNLYIAVRVLDDSIGNKVYLKYAAGAYQGDCLEVFIDARGEKQRDPAFVGRAYHLKIVPPTKEHDEVFCTISKPPDGPLPGLELASLVLPDGYTLELKVPFASLPELEVRPGLNFGLEMYVSDDDESTGRAMAKTTLGWTGLRGGSGNPSKFGRAIIAGRPAR